MKRLLLVPLVLLVSLVGLEAQTPLKLGMDFGAQATLGPGFSTKETVAISGLGPLFEAAARLQINGDGKYGADIANFSASKSFFDNYFYLDHGYVSLHLSQLELQAGRYAQSDSFDSPYSLFLSSENHSTPGLRFRYEDSFFSYESRWIELNHGSGFASVDTPDAWRHQWNGTDYLAQTGTGYPDRGANLRTFTFRFGALKVGLQDAAVYTGRNFDFEHFLSPIPSYFTQYVKGTAGRPWTTSGNENNLLGFFVTWTQPNYNLGLQALFDDFSLHFMLPNDVPNNPWKAAWTFGGRFQTDVGRFGFFHAGALKYTFAPITTGAGQDAQSAYGYTLYPDVEYSVGGGKFRALGITDNALGYLYGENNLAIRLTYDNTFARVVRWATNLEVVVAGSNSPANPWQDGKDSDSTGGTHWLDDPVLQRSLVWTSDLRWLLGDWELYGLWRLGFVGNVLTLQSPSGVFQASDSALDQWVKIFKPSSDGQGIASLAIGATFHFDVSNWQRSVSGNR